MCSIATIENRIKMHSGIDYRFVDCGSGKSGYDCVPQVLITDHIYKTRDMLITTHEEPFRELYKYAISNKDALEPLYNTVNAVKPEPHHGVTDKALAQYL